MPIRLQGRAPCHRARQSGRPPEKHEHERLAAGRPPAPRYSETAPNPNCAGPPGGDQACGRGSGPATGIAPFHLTAVAGRLGQLHRSPTITRTAAPLREEWLAASSRATGLKRRAPASPPSTLDWNYVTGRADRVSTGTDVQPEMNAVLRSPTESERLAPLRGRPAVVRAGACAAVELRHVPRTMHAARTELAPERRAIERSSAGRRRWRSWPPSRHHSPNRSRQNRTSSRIPSCICAAAAVAALPPTSRPTAKRASGSATPAGTSYRHA